ncbi:iron complex transport system ATP-binding protein [Hathewaya proteolytica DSM 3090]|uniref:Iron complex transport system ATP-binding protein n=1 Tax=Hathewaya proteolytica DSM 3090 TaxID=1121331 RepID=A0A1M6K9P7_9CLOT|nr:ABC transporter ATP-binding protein [Hathewaya proteolytica]SHJ55679.1 iron complex transport system ATP-binding protein [Hathewaya proteolytica DSM 3090]
MRVTASEVKKKIGDNNILKGVSIKAESKSFIGILGPNGSGKSTLLRCMYRVLKPDMGVVMLGNDKLQDLTVKESAKKMAVVAQHNYYNFDFSIEEVVLMGRSPHKKAMESDNVEDYKIVDEALKTVGMHSFKGRSFSTLSGGEQQRVILARALAQKTQCLILDEPTNHLDIKYQLQLLDIVKGLNLTVISAIHDLNMAAMYCDYIYVLKNGVIVAEGSPKKILNRELIKDVYEVESEVITDRNGIIHVIYQPLNVM